MNPKFYRPTEVEQLLGDPTKAKTKLGWTPKVMSGCQKQPKLELCFTLISDKRGKKSGKAPYLDGCLLFLMLEVFTPFLLILAQFDLF